MEAPLQAKSAIYDCLLYKLQHNKFNTGFLKLFTELGAGPAGIRQTDEQARCNVYCILSEERLNKLNTQQNAQSHKQESTETLSLGHTNWKETKNWNK